MWLNDSEKNDLEARSSTVETTLPSAQNPSLKKTAIYWSVYKPNLVSATLLLVGLLRLFKNMEFKPKDVFNSITRRVLLPAGMHLQTWFQGPKL